MRLGQILVQQRRLDREQLNQALRRQSAGARPIGEILLELGVVSRHEVVQALLSQPAADLTAASLATVSPKIATQLPRGLAERAGCVLLAIQEGWACVALQDPFHQCRLEEIESFLGRAVIALVAPAEDLVAARQRLYDRSDYVP